MNQLKGQRSFFEYSSTIFLIPSRIKFAFGIMVRSLIRCSGSRVPRSHISTNPQGAKLRS